MPDEPINGREPEKSEDDMQREILGPRGVPGKESPAKMTPQREKKRPKMSILVTRHRTTKRLGQEEQSSRIRVEADNFPNWESLMAEKDLNALFLDTLKDIYYAEKQIYKSLPKMARAAHADHLRAAFEKHHDETEGQIGRLEQIFELLGKPARGKKCDAIEGILDEGKEIMEEYKNEPALDAGLLAAAQAVEHYEISRYGTLKTWASKLNLKDAVKLLDQTLAEEKKTDDALTKLADTAVNAEAA